MKVAWARSIPAGGPIAGRVALPSHPPIVGRPVRLGSFSVTDLLGGPSKGSIAKGIGYGAAGTAAFAGAWFFPAGIPVASGAAKTVLVLAGGYLVYRGASHFVSVADGRSEAEATKEKWTGFLFTPSAPPSLPIAGSIVSPAAESDVSWSSPLLRVLYANAGTIPVVATLQHVGLDRPSPHSQDVVGFAVRATVRGTKAGSGWKVVSSPEPVTLRPGEAATILLRPPHPGVLYTGTNALVGLEIDTNVEFHSPLDIANVPVWMRAWSAF